MKVTALIVQPGGRVDEQKVDFPEIQLSCGGYVQVLDGRFPSHDDIVSVWMNEEGVLRGMPFNRAASAVLRHMADMHPHLLHGAVVFTGTKWDKEEGMMLADLDEQSKTTIRKIIEKEQGND